VQSRCVVQPITNAILGTKGIKVVNRGWKSKTTPRPLRFSIYKGSAASETSAPRQRATVKVQLDLRLIYSIS
jgi:hypothetical protein